MDQRQEMKTPPTAPPGRDCFFRKLYWGEYSLPRTFWIYSFLCQLVFALLFSLLVLGAAVAGSVGLLLLCIVLYLLLLAYAVVCCFGIWRSATKYQGPKLWAMLAKISVVLGVLSTLHDICDLVRTM